MAGGFSRKTEEELQDLIQRVTALKLATDRAGESFRDLQLTVDEAERRYQRNREFIIEEEPY